MLSDTVVHMDEENVTSEEKQNEGTNENADTTDPEEQATQFQQRMTINDEQCSSREDTE